MAASIDYIEDLSKRFLGKMVTVSADRPIGSIHPVHTNIVYPINYGYIEGKTAADGEEQDVYILGVLGPVAEFTGRIIAIIHRKDDAEDKLVSAPDGMVFTAEEIADATRFQEQYFRSNVELWSGNT